MKKILTALFALAILGGALSAQISISGKEQISAFPVLRDSDWRFSLLNYAYMQAEYANDEGTTGACLRIACYIQDDTNYSFGPVRAFGWVKFLDKQLAVSAGLLYNESYTIADYDYNETIQLLILNNDGDELRGCNGLMLEYSPAQVEGLSVAAVYESEYWDSGLSALYTAAKYETEKFRTVLTWHLNDTLYHSMASATAGYSLSEAPHVDAGFKYNMGPIGPDASNEDAVSGVGGWS